ncbi:MAG: hypothetical protein KGI29_05625 [Pseudomonadota bacterium]|nr:hypothetical protein [Pseudomonadota bacterium]
MAKRPAEVLNVKRFDLGVPEWPWPSLEVDYEPGKGYSTVIKTVENQDKPLQIYSKWFGHYQEQMTEQALAANSGAALTPEQERDIADKAQEKAYERVVGIAYRDMPVPSMLQYFKESSNARMPTSKDRLELVIGAPGIGKSYGAHYHSRLRDPKPPLFFDCAGRDLGDLLFELVLDRGSNPDLYSRIQKRLSEHNSGDNSLKAPSLEVLRRPELRQVFSMEGDKIAWDWSEFGNLPKEEAMKDNAPTREQVLEKARVALHEFARDEGIQMNGISDISFKEQKGKLLQAVEEDRNLILDEVNLAKPGGFDKIKVPLQVINGEEKEYTVYSKSGESYSLSSAQFGSGCYVSANGNHVGDGTSTQGLPESVYTRFKQKHFIGRPSVEDFQHRICQKLTGLPISTLYHMQQAAWDKQQNIPEGEKKKDFTDFLQYLRGLGADGQEVVPSHQRAMIDHWEEVIDASAKLAKFYHTWAETMDREELQKKMQAGGNEAQHFNALMMEADEHYTKMVGVGLRMMMGHLNKAENVTPETIPLQQSGGFNLRGRKLPRNPDDLPKEETELRYGTRLTGAIINEIDNTTRQIPKPALNKHLTQLAVQSGILAPDLKEARRGDSKLLADLLDIDSFKGQSVSQQAEMVRDLLCDFLRSRYPDLSTNNDDMIDVRQVEKALRDAAQVQPKDTVVSTHSTRLRVPNSDLDDVSVNPFGAVLAHDSTYDPARKSALAVPVEKLADHDALIMALAIPAMRASNLAALWNKSMISAGEQGAFYSDNEEDNQSLRMAMRDNPKQGVSITTVLCQKGGDKPHEVPIHVIRDDKADKTIIVADGVDARVLRMMQRTNVTYVDRTKPNATATLSRAINQLLEGKPPEVMDDLKGAFQMRNSILPRYRSDDLPLADMMTRDITRCDVKNYVTDIKQLDELSQLSRSFQPTTAKQGR